MWGVQVRRFGGPEQLHWRELPDLTPGAGEAVVEVEVADVQLRETLVRAGHFTRDLSITLPYVPGDGVVGKVVAVGDAAARRWLGRRVVARTGGQGGYAEQALSAVGDLVEIPSGLCGHRAAALAYSGPSALTIFRRAAVRPAEAVLVVAAAGGFWGLLAQLARAADARVIVAADRTRDRDLAYRLGADLVVDVSDPDWPSRVREVTFGAGADVVLDQVGGDVGGTAFDVTARAGLFFSHGAASGRFAPVTSAMAAGRGVKLATVQAAQPSGTDRARLLRLALHCAGTGQLLPVIDQTFPLARAAEAHASIEARTVTGKALLETSAAYAPR